ncbi:MAG: IS110 family transposase [Nitrosopumilus sp.]|nr:IS110 family transposase [Nitrosopumilus sp.]
MRNYTGKTIFIGLDVHKNSYSISVICEGSLIKKDKIVADPTILLSYLRKFKGANIESAYEAGFSGFHLHRILIKNGIKNIIVNPASIEISARDVVKTDKRDSFKIASQLSVGKLSCIYIPTESREGKRNLTRLRKNLIRKRARASNQIKSLLHLHGMIPAFSKQKISTKYIMNILKVKIPPNLQFNIEVLFEEWRFLNLQIKKVTNQISLQMEEDSKLEEIYTSIPGIGSTSAHIMINELDDTLQFSNENKLFSYAGLTPREHSSGEHKRQGHISRLGKPIIRSTLVECSWKAIKTDASLNEIYERIRKRRGKKIAIIAIARILLGRIRTCIKQDRLYYSNLNETKEEVKKKAKKQTKKAA